MTVLNFKKSKKEEETEDDEETLGKHPIQNYDGILLVVDPFAEKGVCAGLVGKFSSEEIDSNNPAPFEATEVLGRLINVLENSLSVISWIKRNDFKSLHEYCEQLTSEEKLARKQELIAKYEHKETLCISQHLNNHLVL